MRPSAGRVGVGLIPGLKVRRHEFMDGMVVCQGLLSRNLEGLEGVEVSVLLKNRLNVLSDFPFRPESLQSGRVGTNFAA